VLFASDPPPPTTPSPQESTLYDTLINELSKEPQQKFLDFLECHEARIDQECEIYFKKGFRVSKKCKILEVSESSQFDDGNIPKAMPNGNNYILRACMKGKAINQNSVININGRYYTPNTGR